MNEEELSKFEQALKSGNFEEKDIAISELRRLGDSQAIDLLIQALEDNDESIRIRVVEILGEICDIKAVEALIFHLQDEDIEVRESTARTLGELGDTRAVDPLIDVLQDIQNVEDKYFSVKSEIIDALSKLEDKRAFMPLLEVLLEYGYYHDVGKKALSVLEKLDESRLTEILIQVSEDSNASVREREIAAWSLGVIDDSEVVDSLIRTIKSKEFFVIRGQAILSLGELGDPKAVEPLIQILQDKNEHEWLRRDAATTLGEFDDPRAVKILIKALYDEDRHLRSKAISALMEIFYLREQGDSQAVDALISLLQDENREIRLKAVYALSQQVLRSKKTVLLFIQLIQERKKSSKLDYRILTQDDRIMLSVISTLGAIGDKRAIDPLIHLLQDKAGDIRAGAVSALFRLKDPKARQPLRDLLIKERAPRVKVHFRGTEKMDWLEEESKR